MTIDTLNARGLDLAPQHDPFLPEARTAHTRQLSGVDQFDRMGRWLDLFMATAEVAKILARTNFVPDAFRGQPEDIAAAMMRSLELGIDPLDGLSNFHAIKGRVGMSAEFMRRRVLEAGHEIVFDEQTEDRCKVRGRRKGSQEWTTVVFTKQHAAQAGTQNMAKFPADMLVARASSRLCRRIFPDVLAGMLIIEDIADGEVIDADPAPVGTGRPLQRKRQPRKAPETRAPAAPAAAEPGPANDLDEFPGAPTEEPGAAGRAIAERLNTERHDEAPSDGEPESPASQPQNRKMHALFRDIGLTDRADRLTITSHILGFPVDTSAGLTVAEASKVIDTLERWQTDPELLREQSVDDRIRDILNTGTLRETEDTAADAETGGG